MKVTQKGQVTIPKRFRDRFLLKKNSKVVFEEKEDGILIQPAKNTDVETIMTKIEKYAGIADVNMTTDQIINLTRDQLCDSCRFKCFVRCFYPRSPMVFLVFKGSI